MHKSKLFRLLSGLTPDEFSRFSKFVASPFYNTNPTQVKFYKLLKKAYPTFDQPNLKKEKVFQRLYPGKPFNYHLLGNLVSDMIRLTNRYFITLQIEKEEMAQKKMLLSAYSEKPNLYSDFVKQVKNMHQYLDGLPHRNAAYYHEKFKLEQLYFNHADTDKFKLKGEQYDTAMQHLDQWYILEKLLMSCELKAREKPLSEKHDIWLLKEIKNNITELINEDSIAETYLAMLNLLEQGEEKTYFDLKKIFIQNLEYFDKIHQQNILQSLINFSIQKGNKGDNMFLAENLELYKLGLEHELFFINGILNDLRYISITIVALKNNDIDWCFNFLNKYETYLASQVSKDAKSLGQGLWLFNQKKSQETIKLINRVEFNNIYYQVQARVLLLRAYFEEFLKNNSYFEIVVYHAKSFEKSINRNKSISKTWKENLLNFNWCIKQLVILIQDKEIKKIKKLKTKIEAIDNVAGKLWLLQKLDKIK